MKRGENKEILLKKQEEIRKHYLLFTNESLETIAKKYNISTHTVQIYCKDLPKIKLNGEIGEQHHISKLTQKNAIQILISNMQGNSQRSLAKEYGVTPQAVSSLCSGRTWKWLFQEKPYSIEVLKIKLKYLNDNTNKD